MNVELRHTGDGKGGSVVRGLVLTAENEQESKALDAVFGKKVDWDGLIGERKAECRLADGYGEHYVYIHAR